MLKERHMEDLMDSAVSKKIQLVSNYFYEFYHFVRAIELGAEFFIRSASKRSQSIRLQFKNPITYLKLHLPLMLIM